MALLQRIHQEEERRAAERAALRKPTKVQAGAPPWLRRVAEGKTDLRRDMTGKVA